MSPFDTARYLLPRIEMQNRGSELSDLAHSVGTLSQISEKLASVEGSIFAQQISAIGADAFYTVMRKEAMAVGGTGPVYQKMLGFIDKLAEVLNKPAPSPELRHKLAAVVTTDDAITEVLGADKGEKTAAVYGNLFGMRGFGREFFVELLQKVI